MLFILTGDIQIGKTRWLEALAGSLSAAGVPCAGVIAPGVWREYLDENRQPSYEKLGINNLLLPEGKVVPFAQRRDIAQAAGSYRTGSQSAQAGLGWEISDDAIAQVNEHFRRLASAANSVDTICAADTANIGNATNTASTTNSTDATSTTNCTNATSTTNCANATNAANTAGAASTGAPGLLIVDELGQLELKRNGGLTAAMALLDRGPTTAFPHALIVVREWLVPDALARFESAWGSYECISPNNAARAQIAAIFDVLL